jgi:hypothetical protein
MVTRQQIADAALARWKELDGLPAEDRIEIVMEDFFREPVLDREHEAALRLASEAIADA